MSPNEHVLQLDMKTLQDSLLEAQTNAECNLLHFNEVAAYNDELQCDLARHRVAVEGLQNDVTKLAAEVERLRTLVEGACTSMEGLAVGSPQVEYEFLHALTGRLRTALNPTKPQAGSESARLWKTIKQSAAIHNALPPERRAASGFRFDLNPTKPQAGEESV